MILFDILNIDGSYIIIGLMVGFIILFILFMILYIKSNRLSNAYCKFMSGSDGKTLETSILSRFETIDKLVNETEIIKKNINTISETLLSTYQYISLNKYDAFREMGGKLSFSLCMLDARKNGFILTSMHNSREGCYTYIKEIINGESYVLLSEEEKKALNNAKEKALFKR